MSVSLVSSAGEVVGIHSAVRNHHGHGVDTSSLCLHLREVAPAVMTPAVAVLAAAVAAAGGRGFAGFAVDDIGVDLQSVAEVVVEPEGSVFVLLAR